jgi:hypothetical protein
MTPAIASDPEFKAAALDEIDVVYEVNLKCFVTAGAYNGIADKAALAQIINDGPPIAPENIESATIVEVRLSEEVIASSTGDAQ